MTTADRIEGAVEWLKLLAECLAMIALAVWLSGMELI